MIKSKLLPSIGQNFQRVPARDAHLLMSGARFIQRDGDVLQHSVDDATNHALVVVPQSRNERRGEVHALKVNTCELEDGLLDVA